MAWDARKHVRVAFAQGLDATLMGMREEWRRDCKVIDVCAAGAKLTLSDGLELLQTGEFFLRLNATGAVLRHCKVIRQSGREVGVRFLLKPASPSRARS